MKTRQDLQLLYRQEFGEYPVDDEDYMNWLEAKVLAETNKETKPWKSSFDRQMEAKAEPWKP
jgi:hypothetical protein